MIIHLQESISLLDYKDKITIDNYKLDTHSKGAAIRITYKQKSIVIPWSNITFIEEK